MHDSRLELLTRLETLSPHQRSVLRRRLASLRGDQLDTATGRRASSPSSSRLVAYVVPRAGTRLDHGALRKALAVALPEYMIPSAFVEMDALPRGAHGKVDSSALPAVDLTKRGEDSRFTPPSTEDEILMAEIWAEVLQTDLVGLHDNFLEIGGHSLLAVQLLGRIRDAFDADLPMEAMFEAATVAATLERVHTFRWAAAGDEAAEHDDASPHEDVEF